MSRRARLVIVAPATLALAAALAAAGCTERHVHSAGAGDPLVATHRGDPALPENTLAAFRSALEMGADHLEVDLVATRDGVLVLRHDRHLSPTTDVEERPDLAGRRTTKTVNGRAMTDWWVEDFTLAELETLRATVRDTAPSGDHRISTLRELIDFAREETEARGRRIGLYLELKQPAVSERLGHDLEDLLAEVLSTEGLDRADGGVYLQSWDPESVRELGAALRAPAVQLLSAARRWRDDVTRAGLRQLRGRGVDGINVAEERLEGDPGLIGRAHAAGLFVHGWGFERGDDYARWIDAGIDGFVTDDVPGAVEARDGG